MKTLITKADGTPTKSKVRALQYLESKGISKDCLVEENGQFFYECQNEEHPKMDVTPHPQGAREQAVSWETPVFNKNNERTEVFIPGTDVYAKIIGKHPAGQLKQKSCFEINIGDENFLVSAELMNRIFKVRG